MSDNSSRILILVCDAVSATGLALYGLESCEFRSEFGRIIAISRNSIRDAKPLQRSELFITI